MENIEEFLTPQQICEILGISYDACLHLIKSEIPHFKVGRRYRVRAIKFRQWYKKKEKRI